MSNLVSNDLDKTNEFTNARRRLLLLTLTIACSLGQVASTIYVPSVPAIAGALETSVSRVQLTFVAYLAAFAVSMLVLGPLSDRYGRRRTMVLGIAVSTLGSISCAASPTIGFLIGARVLQGIGLSGGMVVGRATIRDLYGEDGAARIIAGLSIVLTLLQALAPIPGGYLQAWIGWRANFAAVAILAVVALALVLRYVPGSPPREGPARPENGLRQNNAGRLSQFDRNPAFCRVRTDGRRGPCGISYLCRRRSGGVNHRARHSSARLRLLCFAATYGLSRRQLSVQSADAVPWRR